MTRAIPVQSATPRQRQRQQQLRLRPLALPLLMLLCACAPKGQETALERVRQSGTLRWGADLQGGEPFVFEDPKKPGALAGFEVEIADALARELGVRAEFVQNDWSTLVPSLERGTFDIALNGLEVTAAREQRLRFSRPYYLFSERLVARAGDARVRDLASLRGLRVGTLANSLAWDILGTVGAERIPYEGQEEPFLDLEKGRTDAVLLDDIIVAQYANRPGLVTIGDVAEGKYAIGLRRQDADLWRAVDEALGRLARSGQLRTIFKRWQIDNERQEALAGIPTVSGAPGPRAPRRPLDGHQVTLFLRGAAVTLLISGTAMVIAICGGLLLAMARQPSPHAWRRPIGWLATAYVEIFRGTPVLLQLFVIYYGLASVWPLDAYLAAILGLGLNYAAYEAENYRAGIQAVPRGEIEAAYALGMTGRLAFRRVVLPQAFRFSLPGVANDFIALLKDSSLVSVITVVELTKRMTIAAVDLGDWAGPGALCALMYFAMSYPLSRLARRLEAHLGQHR